MKIAWSLGVYFCGVALVKRSLFACCFVSLNRLPILNSVYQRDIGKTRTFIPCFPLAREVGKNGLWGSFQELVCFYVDDVGVALLMCGRYE